MKDRLTIVISSSDEYEDCWNPFFTLFNKFWPDCNIPILLISNGKAFQFPPLNIICPISGNIDGKSNKWGGAFLKTLYFVDTEVILVLMIDYFIRSPVQVDILKELVDLVYRDNLTNIQILSNVPGPNYKSKYPMLLERGQLTPYRFCLQAGLWRKDRLKYYIREYEDPWLAETWGTKRAWRIKDSFYCLDREFEKCYGNIIDYHHLGGMRQGKWRKEEVVDLFNKHGIDIDYSIRGFYDDERKISYSERLTRKLYRLPLEVKSWFDLYMMNV